MHAYDRLLAVRTLLCAVLLAVIALGTVLATDEPFSTPAMRVARMSALVPLLAALSIAIVLGQARSRGELAALAALGAGPVRVALGALAAGWLLGAVAIVLVLSPLADVSALFPAVATPAEWRVDGRLLVAPASGVVVSPDGVLALLPASGARADGQAPHAASAALALGPLGVTAPLWAAAPAPLLRRLLGAGCSVVLALVLLHAVASERVPPAALVLASLPLAIDVVLGHFRRAPR
jgi:hypothetical protein